MRVAAVPKDSGYANTSWEKPVDVIELVKVARDRGAEKSSSTGASHLEQRT